MDPIASPYLGMVLLYSIFIRLVEKERGSGRAVRAATAWAFLDRSGRVPALLPARKPSPLPLGVGPGPWGTRTCPSGKVGGCTARVATVGTQLELYDATGHVAHRLYRR